MAASTAPLMIDGDTGLPSAPECAEVRSAAEGVAAITTVAWSARVGDELAMRLVPPWEGDAGAIGTTLLVGEDRACVAAMGLGGGWTGGVGALLRSKGVTTVTVSAVRAVTWTLPPPDDALYGDMTGFIVDVAGPPPLLWL